MTLDLGVGSSVNVKDKKTQQYMTSYGFSTSDSTATAAIGKLSGTHTPINCLGRNGDKSNLSAIWAAQSTVSPMPTALSNSSTGCCSDTLFVGSIFLPGQAVNFGTNQACEDVGSVYVGDWNVQSGAHPNPVVTYDIAGGAFVTTELRLVE